MNGDAVCLLEKLAMGGVERVTFCKELKQIWQLDHGKIRQYWKFRLLKYQLHFTSGDSTANVLDDILFD